MRINLLLAATVLVFSTSVHSFNGWINFHVGSHHLQPYYKVNGEPHPYNEANFGIGVALPISSNIEASTGFFENSYNKTSAYVAANLHTANSRGFSVGVNSGIVTGYENTPVNGDKLRIMVLPHVTYALKNFRTEVGYAPSFGIEGSTSIIVLTIGTRF